MYRHTNRKGISVMATKKQIRMYAEANGISREAARQHFIDEAIKRNRAPQHVKNKKAGGKLTTFYWGYKANKGDQGFEFSTMTAKWIGLDNKQTLEIGRLIKEASDHQLMHYINNTTMQEYGLTREQFVAEEKDRLLDTTHNLNQLTKGFWSLQDIMADLMIWCCAVSTLVAAGEIKQDEWNGDKFGYMFDKSNPFFNFV